MNNILKRFLLYLIACMGSRATFAFIAKKINTNTLPLLGYLALIPALGFTYIYLTGSRQTGGEVFGDKIWWNDLRPIHALLYYLFAFNAIYKNKNSWIFLAIDVIIGFFAFIAYHYREGNFNKLITID